MNDYPSVFDYEYSAHEYLHENHATYNIQDSYDLDEEYARDTCDYSQLAYIHYA